MLFLALCFQLAYELLACCDDCILTACTLTIISDRLLELGLGLLLVDLVEGVECAKLIHSIVCSTSRQHDVIHTAEEAAEVTCIESIEESAIHGACGLSRYTPCIHHYLILLECVGGYFERSTHSTDSQSHLGQQFGGYAYLTSQSVHDAA